MIIGLDTGGTHVDAVLIEQGKIIATAKVRTNRSDLLASILQTLEELLENQDVKAIKKINLSTTITTNAIVEGKGQPVAMFIESGPGIDPRNFSCGDYHVFLDGNLDHRGWEIRPFSPQLIHNELPKISAHKITGAAVVSKFSTRNPSHELEIKNILTENGFNPVTMGHSLSGKLNFPRRIYTAYLNSAIYNYFNDFAVAIKTALQQKGLRIPIYILKADGGTILLNEASHYPVQTILSGPAASVMGSLAFFDLQKDTLLLDIGGTTTDIAFLADGVPLFVPNGINIAGYPTLVRAIFNTSIGLGGDSGITIKPDGEIKIGPERQGPPMALDGPTPTPSDAMIVLGKLNFGDRSKAHKAIQLLGEKLNLPAITVAQKVYKKFAALIKASVDKILEEINSHPVYTIHELLHGKTLDPKEIVIIGGPAQAVAPLIREEFNLTCKVPAEYHIANAVGAALTKRTFEINLLADTETEKLTISEIGIYKHINNTYTLADAKQEALNLLKKQLQELGETTSENAAEIVEASSFNMVRNFSTTGKNIRVRAQIKPGLIGKIGGKS